MPTMANSRPKVFILAKIFPAGVGGVCRHAAVWTDAMDEGFAQPLARGLEGCPFRVEDLCLRVEETPACREVAADLCALLRRKDI